MGCCGWEVVVLMKRGKPLKRTPLKRGSSSLKRTPLKSKTQLKAKTPLNYRSAKTKEVYKSRRKIVRDMLEEYSECQACVIIAVYDRQQEKSKNWNDRPSNRYGVIMARKPVDIHELINRSQGGSILENKNLMAVCRECHMRITENPKEAELLGLHLPSWCDKDEHFKEAARVRNCWQRGFSSLPFWLEQ